MYVPRADQKLTEDGSASASFALRFGWRRFRPARLQSMNTPKWFLFFMFMYFFTQSIVVNGVYTVSITTIERRYSYSSSLTGFLTSSFDIAALALTPFVSFLGAKRKKPVWCGVGLLTMGIGMLVFLMPHLLSGRYEAGSARAVQGTSGLCNSTSASGNTCISASGHVGYYALFVIGMLIMGAGATPMIALGIPYMDENVKEKVSPMYVGIFYASGVIGAGVGFALGGVFLAMYVDLGSQTSLTPKDERWVGAWWPAFAICGVLCIMWSAWLFAFPRRIPSKLNDAVKNVKIADTDDVEMKNIAPPSVSIFKEITYLPKATKDLLWNVTYAATTFAGCMDVFNLSGFAAFAPKLLQSQLRLSTSQVSFLYGAVAICAALFGNLLGAYINKRLRLTLRGAAMMCLIVALMGALFTAMLTLNCETAHIAGVNTPYRNGTSTSSLLSACNTQCSCSKASYSPVCSDGVTYFSPCYAGCVTRNTNGTLADCSCISHEMQVSAGVCRKPCGYKFHMLLIAVFLIAFSTFLNQTPATIVSLRCLDADERTYGIGFQMVLFRLLGFIPGPVVFGSLIDKACILWSYRCDVQGNCLEYSNAQLAYTIFAICLVSKCLVSLGFLIAWLHSRKVQSQSAALEPGKTNIEKVETIFL